jgi:5-methylcytosine-specific restriction enzyme subunit McrC
MLAYCTALGLERGFLVYASDSGERARTHHIRNGKCVVEVRTLDVEAKPTELLAVVEALAEEVVASGPARVAVPASSMPWGGTG